MSLSRKNKGGEKTKLQKPEQRQDPLQNPGEILRQVMILGLSKCLWIPFSSWADLCYQPCLPSQKKKHHKVKLKLNKTQNKISLALIAHFIPGTLVNSLMHSFLRRSQESCE